MIPANPAIENPRLMSTLGMYLLPYDPANFPGLAETLARIYQDRIQGIPWIPQDWLTKVMADHGRVGILMPAPYQVGFPTPWLDTPDKRAWWNQFAETARQANVQYAAGMMEQGRIILEKAYANIAFWDMAYKIASTLAAPVFAAKWLLTSGALWPMLGLGAAALLILRRRK